MESSSLRHSTPLRIVGLPVVTKCFGSRTAAGLVGRHLAGDQPPEQHPDGSELLLDARRRVLCCRLSM
jgi:hypothetical protein